MPKSSSLILVLILIIGLGPSLPAQARPREDNITGYRCFQFNTPAWALEDLGLTRIDRADGLDLYAGEHQFVLSECGVKAWLQVQCMADEPGAGYVDKVVIHIWSSDLVRDHEAPLPSMAVVYDGLARTLLDCYDGQLVLANMRSFDVLGEADFYLYLNDSDNDSLWLRLQYGMIELGYMSSQMRALYGSTESR